jgi:hypothetical protein
MSVGTKEGPSDKFHIVEDVAACCSVADCQTGSQRAQ